MTGAIIGLFTGLLTVGYGAAPNLASQIAVGLIVFGSFILFFINLILWAKDQKFETLEDIEIRLPFILGILIAMIIFGVILRVAFRSEPLEFWENVMKFAKITILLNILLWVLRAIGLFLADVDWNAFAILLGTQLFIFIAIAYISHNVTQSKGLRRTFSILGFISLIIGAVMFTFLMMALLVAALLSELVKLFIEIFAS